ncbi:hypothetical protein [Nocardia otitidiscaviarum]|nr:hypothetical protein [Nocardia otitidiscaviarum]
MPEPTPDLSRKHLAHFAAAPQQVPTGVEGFTSSESMSVDWSEVPNA